MDEGQLRKMLQALAHYVVRNEIVCEHYLASLGVPPDEISAKVREIDEQLQENTHWQNRFPGLFQN